MQIKWPIDKNLLNKDNRCYLLSGNEDLLLEQSRRQIVKLAKQRGFNAHHILYSSNELNLSTINTLVNNQNLFSEGILLDIRLPEGKTGHAGVSVLNNIINKLTENTSLFLLITADKISKKLTAKWVDKIHSYGIHVEHPLLTEYGRQKWLKQRLSQNNTSLGTEEQQFLLAITEGNLLALEQQILQLEIAQIKTITLSQLRLRFEDETRFNLFSLPEKIFSGQIAVALRMCRRLRQEGKPLPLLLWAVLRELKLCIQIVEIKQNGGSVFSFFKKNRVWEDRQKILLNLARQPDQLHDKLHQIQHIDEQIKGLAIGDSWLSFERFITKIISNTK